MANRRHPKGCFFCVILAFGKEIVGFYFIQYDCVQRHDSDKPLACQKPLNQSTTVAFRMVFMNNFLEPK